MTSTSGTSARNPKPLLLLAVAVGVVVLAAVALIALRPASAAPPRTITLQTLNDSGVTGSVAFSDLGGSTQVDVMVDPGDNPDMPAHIHPGSCADLTPQPKYPLENVREGRSTTVVPAGIDELFAGGLAVNVHKSNDDLKTYTACVDIR